jgi:hypothetical protein
MLCIIRKICQTRKLSTVDGRCISARIKRVKTFGVHYNTVT